MQGQAHHFRRYAPDKEKHKYSLARYSNETRRLYNVLEAHLSKTKSRFLVGDRATVADFSTLGWVLCSDWAGIDIREFPNLEGWEQRVYNIPGVKRGTEIPKPLNVRQMTVEEQEEFANNASKWIVQGNQEKGRSA